MANAVDERIVEARFDASDFEKGVNKTLEKLNELKESLNLKDSGKSIAQFADEASKGVEKAGSALDRLSERFTTFKGMIKQQILSGLASEISNTFLKIEQGLARFTRSISSDQIGAGMTKYTEILNSVRTMTAAGVDEGLAYDKIKRLAEYSDQTSYSLSQMTSGMSKLVAAGMDVDKAEKSMEGLANMAASAGVNIYDAQRAFLNFSQAYGSGKMQVKDWVSFENLNMATEPVMKIFMQAAEQVGNLTKAVDKNGKEIYKTSNKINKQVKANKEVTTSGFRDTLNYGWLDKATMEQATAVLSYFEDLGVDLNTLTKDQLNEFATKAFQAAKEARSFADVMGTLKDVVATGWATTFELIFGKLEKATEFFTWLTESNMAEVIYNIGEFRNDVLRAWGADYLEGGLFKARDENGNYGTGRDVLLDGLKNIDEMIGVVKDSFEGMFPEGKLIESWDRNLTFAENIGYNLAKASLNFKYATVRIKDFFTTFDAEGNRILRPEYVERFRKIFGGIGGAIGVFTKISNIASDTFKKLFYKLQPIADGIGDAIGSILEPFKNLNENTQFFDNLRNAADNLLKVLDPVIKILKPFTQFLGKLGGFFLDTAISSISTTIEVFAEGLGLIIELFGGKSGEKVNNGIGIIEGWGKSLEEFANTCKEGLGAVKDFFTTLFNDIRALLGVKNEIDGHDGGFFQGVVGFFKTNEFVQKVKAGVLQGIQNIKNFILSIPSKIKNIGSVFSKLWDSLMYTEATDYTPTGKKEHMKIRTPLKRWLDNSILNAENFIKSIPGRLLKIPSVIGTFLHGLLYEKKTDEKTGKEYEVPTALGKWLENAKSKAQEFLASIPGRIASIPSLMGEFLHGLFWKKTTNAETGEVEEVRTKLGDWLDKAGEKVTNFVTNDIPGFVQNLPSHLKAFLHNLFWRQEVNMETGEVTEVHTKLADWLEKAGARVKSFITADIPQFVDRLLDGSLITKFVNAVFSKQDATDQSGTTVGEVPGAFETWLTETIEATKVWAKTLPGKVSSLWTTILNGLFGNTTETFSQDMYDQLMREDPTGDSATIYERSFDQNGNKILNSAETTVSELGSKIGEIVGKLPTFIANGVNRKISMFGDLLTHVTNWLGGKNAEAQAAQAAGADAASLVDKALETAAAETEGAKEELSPFLKALVSIGTSIKGLVVETIPPFLSEAWTFISGQGDGLWNAINQIFELPDLGEVQTKVTEIGTTISNAIKSLPNLIRGAVRSIKTFFEGESTEVDFSYELGGTDGDVIDIDGLEKNIKATKQRVKQGGFLSAIKEIGGAIGDAFIDLGPDILNGINTGLTWISNKTSDFAKLLNARDKSQPFNQWLTELIAGKEGAENSQLASAVQSLGMTIKTLITSTLPSFISAAFSEVAVGIPRLISTLFSGVSDSDAAAEAATTALENESKVIDKAVEVQDKTSELSSNDQTAEVMTAYAAGFNQYVDALRNMKKTGGTTANLEGTEESLTEFGSIMQLLGNIFSGFTENNTVAAVAKITGVVAIIWALKSLIDNLVITDDFAETAKWGAIKTAVMGIVGMIGYLIYLSETGNDTQLENVKSVFDKVISLFDRLAQVLLVMKGLKLGTSIADIFGTAKGAGGIMSAAGAGLGKGAGYILGGITAVGVGGEILTEAVSSWSGNLTETFEKIGIGMDDLVKAIQDLAGINDKIDAAKEGVGRVSELFEELRNIFVIEEPRTESFENEYVKKSILSEFNQIMNMFISFSGAMALFKQSISTTSENTTGVTDALGALIGMKDDMKTFADFAKDTSFMDFKTALMSLGGALQLYSLADVEDFNKPLENWRIENAVGLLQQIFGNHQLRDLIQTLSVNEIGDTNDLMRNAENITIFAGALVSIARACGELTDETGGDIQKLVTTLQDIKPENEESITSISAQFGELGNAIASFAVNTTGLTEANLSNAEAALKMVLALAVGLKDIPTDTVLAKIFTGDKSLERFGAGLEVLGGNLKRFFESIQNLGANGSVDYNRTNLDQALMAIDAVSTIAVRLRNARYSSTTWQDAESWITGPIGDLTGFGTNIITFLTELNSYDVSENKPINFAFIYNALEAIGKLVEIPNRMPYYKDLPAKIKQVGEIMNGLNGTVGHNGIMGYLNGFYASVIQVASEYGGAYNAGEMSAILTSYATMVEQIVDLLTIIGGKEGDLLGVTETTNPMEYLIPVFASINDNYDVIKQVLDNAKTFDQDGIQNVKDFFGNLKDLASALYLFSQQDSATGDFNVLTGLSNMLNFNWEALTSVKDNVIDIFEVGDFAGAGRSAGANLDAGLAEGIGSGAALAAAQALAGAIKGSFTVSWEISSPSKVFAGFGKFLDQGLQQGIDDNSDGPIDAATMMAQESVDNVTSILETIKDLAISDMDITPTITPVVDMSNVDAAAERLGLLGFNGTPFTFDTNNLNANANAANPTYNRETVQPSDYSNFLASIKGEIASLGSRIVNIPNAFGGMQVVLDTGAIVGGIIGSVDSELGRRGFYATREA